MSRHNEEVPQEHNGVLKLNSRCIFHTGVMLCCAWQLEFVTFFRNHGVAEINGHLAMCKIIADAPDGVHAFEYRLRNQTETIAELGTATEIAKHTAVFIEEVF